MDIVSQRHASYKSGRKRPECQTQSSQIFELASLPEIKAGEELSVLFEFSLKRDTSWAKAGHNVAYDQFDLDRKAPKAKAAALNLDKQTLNLGNSKILFSNQGYRVLETGQHCHP